MLKDGDLKVGGVGMVLPPKEKENTFPAYPFDVTIDKVSGENDGLVDEDGKPAISEYQNVRLIYPNGRVKNHQVKTVEDLASKVVLQLRGMFGNGEVNFKKIPSALKINEKFTIGV